MNKQLCHTLAPADTLSSISNETMPRKGDDSLFQALVAGCHIETAAKQAGVSVRTVYRRLADPVFKQQLEEARESLRTAILANLANASEEAISTLWTLMQDSENETIRLKAAKIILDALAKQQPCATSNRTNVNAPSSNLQINV